MWNNASITFNNKVGKLWKTNSAAELKENFKMNHRATLLNSANNTQIRLWLRLELLYLL